MTIREATADDAAEIAYIYNYYIATSHSTFELDPIDASEMERRFNEAIDSGYPFLVSESEGKLNGYAYGRCFRPRAAYLHSAEISVYVRPGNEGRGIGTALYQEILPLFRSGALHTLIAGIALPNESCIHLHEKFGFHKVAHFEQVGRKFERWIDVGYWQLHL